MKPRPRQPDPTPQEIDHRAAEIRKGWSNETRYLRMTGRRKPVPYELPQHRVIYDPKDPCVLIGIENV